MCLFALVSIIVYVRKTVWVVHPCKNKQLCKYVVSQLGGNSYAFMTLFGAFCRAWILPGSRYGRSWFASSLLAWFQPMLLRGFPFHRASLGHHSGVRRFAVNTRWFSFLCSYCTEETCPGVAKKSEPGTPPQKCMFLI